MFGYTIEQVLDAAKRCYMNDDLKVCEGCALKDACGVNPKALEAEMINHLSAYLDLRNTMQSVNKLTYDLENVKNNAHYHSDWMQNVDRLVAEMTNRLNNLEAGIAVCNPNNSLLISNAKYDAGLLNSLLSCSPIGLINRNDSLNTCKDSEEK